MARDSKRITQYCFTCQCHPHMNHTCLYPLATQHRRPFAGTQLRLPTEGWPGWVDGWLVICFPHRELYPDWSPIPVLTEPCVGWCFYTLSPRLLQRSAG